VNEYQTSIAFGQHFGIGLADEVRNEIIEGSHGFHNIACCHMNQDYIAIVMQSGFIA